MPDCKLHQMQNAFLSFLNFLLIYDRSLFNFIYEYTLVQVRLFAKVLEYIFDCECFRNNLAPLYCWHTEWFVLRFFQLI